MSAKPYTPHKDVNAVLDTVLNKAKVILGQQFVGMYLYGSLASGDFNPESSDIDFAVVTTEMLADETISNLEAMHKQIWASGARRASRLEGSYIPKDLIRRHDPNGPPCPTVNEGEFFIDQRGSDWIINRYVIRECGVVLEGPDPKTLVDPVSPDEIRQAVFGTLSEWWFPMLDDPGWLEKHSCNYHGYAVITMCRALHALETGTIVSKPVATRWIQEKFDEQWTLLIERAWATQLGKKDEVMDGALEFIRFTRSQVLAQSRGA